MKNRLKVALSTVNPPHTHCTESIPIYGIADKRFVITVAPPAGKSWPLGAVALWIHLLLFITIIYL